MYRKETVTFAVKMSFKYWTKLLADNKLETNYRKFTIYYKLMQFACFSIVFLHKHRIVLKVNKLSCTFSPAEAPPRISNSQNTVSGDILPGRTNTTARIKIEEEGRYSCRVYWYCLRRKTEVQLGCEDWTFKRKSASGWGRGRGGRGESPAWNGQRSICEPPKQQVIFCQWKFYSVIWHMAGLLWGFRTQQCLKSLAPVINYFFMIMMTNDSVSTSSWHLSYSLGKYFKQENGPDRGSNPGPLGERQRCYPSTTTVFEVI